MKRKLVTRITFLLLCLSLLAACGSATEPVDLETTVQAAIQATLSVLTERAPTVEPAAAATASPEPMESEVPALSAGSQRVAALDGMTQLYVPEGEFLMGSPEGDPEVFPHERPQHRVYLDAFWIDRTEVTNAMYANCVAAGGCSAPRSPASNTRDSYYGNSAFSDYPVVWVDWSQAEAYCGWAGRRLPTEAEWEKAARGVDGRYYPWGAQPVAQALLADFEDVSGSCALAHYAACEPYRDTSQVGGRPQGASPYGALDMAGNVWEWVSDWYGDTYYQVSPESNPLGPESGSKRILRGGSFAANFSRDLRAAHRYPFDPDQTIYAFGIRCAQSQPSVP
jgi:formylglycine-generating enzyme required for sulfatase activity